MIPSNSSLTNQFVPDFKLSDLVNGQILVYSSADKAFLNTSILGDTVTITSDNIADGSIKIDKFYADNDKVVGAVLGVGTSGELTYLTLDGNSVAALSGLSDTNITTPISGNILSFNGTSWINVSPTLNILQDVNVTSPVDGEFLLWDSNTNNWINGIIDYSVIQNAPTIPTNNDLSLLGLSDTANTIVYGAYLRWETDNDSVEYVSSIPASDIDGLPPVAVSGAYADLTGKPNLAIYAQSSSLSSVATSGSYADLSNKPFIPTLLSDLSNVASTAPSTGNFLRYNGTKWEATATTIPTNIDSLTDVIITTPTNGMYLKYDGVKWVNAVIDWSDLTNVPSTYVAQSHTHPATDITGLSTWLISHNNSLKLENLGDVGAKVANGILMWNGAGTSVISSTTLSATIINGLSDVATSGLYSDLSGAPSLSAVAISGLYSDLIGAPTISSINDLSDVAITTPVIKQSLVFDGSVWRNQAISYNDLTGKPTLFSGAYADLTGKPSTFTPSSHTHVKSEITDLVLVENLSDLADVDLLALTTGDILQWAGSAWVPTAFTISNKSIDELVDVLITSATNGQALVYNSGSGKWVNSTLPYSSLSGVPTTFTPSAHQHVMSDITDKLTWLVNNNNQLNLKLLADATSTPVANGYLRWNGSGNQVVYQTTIPATVISGLPTVAVSGAYADLTGKPSIPSTLDDFTDVIVTTPATDQVLKFNGSSWVNATLAYSALSGTPTNNTYSLQGLSDTANTIVADGFLRWNGAGNSVIYQNTISTADITGLSTVATSGAYADLTGKPTIPTNSTFSFIGLSDTDNAPVANGFLRWNSGASSISYTTTISSSVITGLATVATSGLYSDIAGTPNLAVYALSSSLSTVATSGLYSDLSGTPNLAVYALSSSLSSVATSGAYADLTGTPNLAVYALSSSLSTVATSGSYHDLSNKPAIPTNSQFTLVDLSDTAPTPVANGFLRWNALGNQVVYQTSIPTAAISGLATVATSGSYADLSNKPTNASYTIVGLSDVDDTAIANGFLRWNGAGTSVSYTTTISSAVITGLATVATSGAYADLTGKPTLFSGAYADLTGKPSTFTPSSHSHVKADITDLNTMSIDELVDVDTTTVAPTTGQVLAWDGIKWHPASPIPISSITTLGDVADVPVTNGYLRWNSAANAVVYEQNISASVITGLSLVSTTGDISDLVNVDITGLANNDVLVYNSSTEKWEVTPFTVNDIGTHSINDLLDVVISAPANGKYLKYLSGEWVDSFIDYNEIVNAPANSSFSLLGLSDTNNVAIANGYLRWNSAGTAVEYTSTIPYSSISGLSTVAHTGVYADLTGKPTVPATLNDLTDVVITAPSLNDVLTFNGTSWISSPAASVPSTLDALTDVTITTPSNGDVLSYNGSQWVSQKLDTAFLIDTTFATVATSGDYNDLTNKPTLSFVALTDTSNSVINSGFVRWNSTGTTLVYQQYINASTDLTNLGTAIAAVRPDLATPASSGDYKLQYLNDVSHTIVPNGYLRWNGAGTQVIFQTTLSVDALTEVTNLADVATTGSIGDLIDVDVTGVADGKMLRYDVASSKWKPSSVITSSWTTITTNTAATNGSAYMVDTTSTAVTVTLPATPTANTSVKIADYAGKFSTNACTVARNGSKINGVTRDLVLTRNHTSLELVYIDSTIGWTISSGLGESSQWKTVTTNYTAQTTDDILVDTTSTAVTITLPASPVVGDYVRVCDALGTFSTKKCTISRNGSNIMGGTTDITMMTANSMVELTYVGSGIGWKITSSMGSIGGVNVNSAPVITTNTIIYVSTAGNDTTGTGSVSAPYATISKALDSISGSVIQNGVTVTISVSAGVFNLSEISIQHPNGDQIEIVGATPVVSTTITSSTVSTTTSSITFPVSSVVGLSIGDYISITATTSSNALKNYILGIHEITNISGSNITIQTSVAIAKGSFVLTGGNVSRYETILKFTGTNGVVSHGSKLGLLNNVALVGNDSSNTYGILAGYDVSSSTKAIGCAAIKVGSGVGVYRFGGAGVYASSGSTIYASGIQVTRNARGILATHGASILAPLSIVTDCTTTCVESRRNSTIDVTSANVHYVTNGSLLYLLVGGLIDATTITLSDSNVGGDSVEAYGSGMIVVDDYTIDGVTYNPTHSMTGNGNAYIGNSGV